MHKAKNDSDIKLANRLISSFSETYITIYGSRCQTFTFHLLSKHLIEDVEYHGSLIGHSMFHLEGALGHFSETIQGTRGYSNQYIQSNQYFI